MAESPADDLTLAAEFPAASYEQWRALVEGVLKGARFEERLQSRSADGLVIEPLYRRARDASLIPGRAGGARWQVMQRIDHPDPAMANAQALDDLAGGANGLVLVAADAPDAHGYGLPPAAEALVRALDGIHLEAGIAVELDIGPQSADWAPALAALVRQRGLAPAALDIRFGLDGAVPARELAAQGFTRALTVADGRVVHAAGGTEAQELGYTIATAVALLRTLEAGGIALDDARRMIFFRLAADSDQLLTIAKFRALRALWRRVEESCGLAPEPAFVAAETAWRTMTRNDPLVNILRATIATVAAGFGGADAVTVLPFTAARGLPDGFARRVARNTQLVLLDEAHLAAVADPTAGTGWSEALTEQLARAAWALFQEIEGAGGPAAALSLLQRKVAAARVERERAVATRRIALVGANEFPDLGEANVAVLNVAPGRSTAPPAPFAPMRLAEPFEALREASDRVLAATGRRPHVFLANLGAPADFTARATFAKNLFEAGGIEAVGNDGAASVDELIAAFRAAQTPLACLCGSDESYARDAATVARALTEVGAKYLWSAGKPGAIEADLQRAGIGGCIYSGCDVLATLRDAHHRLGM
jgi:methylmalonyl-CoA mutase